MSSEIDCLGIYNAARNHILIVDPFKFDKYDRLILKELDENARKQLSELSKKVGLSRDAIRNRIKKLIAKHVIDAFKPIYNPPLMGFPIINLIRMNLLVRGNLVDRLIFFENLDDSFGFEIG